jgi:hypothetical protein
MTIERLDAKCYTCDDIETNCADLVVPYAGITWDIVDCLCTAVIGTTGTYFTLLNCEGALSYIESCQESWNCINGNCIDPGNGSGYYNTLVGCQRDCNVPPSWNCINGNCIDPGNGSGTYTTLSACQSECKPREVSTWTLVTGGTTNYTNPVDGSISTCNCVPVAGTSGQFVSSIECWTAAAANLLCGPIGNAGCLSTTYNTPENELWLGADPYFNSPTSFPFDDCTDLQVVSPPSNLFSIGLSSNQGIAQWLATNYPTTSTKDSKICVPIPPPNWFNKAVGTISGYPGEYHCNCTDDKGNPGTWGHGISWTQTNASLGITIKEYSWSAFVNACLATGDPIYFGMNVSMTNSQATLTMLRNWNQFGNNIKPMYLLGGDTPPGIGLGNLESCWCSTCPPL